jgi:lipoate-protein ligase A
MRCCDLTLATPEENLSCDEALLDLCEEGHSEELLRFWQPAQYFVVVGYSNKVATEVKLQFCDENRIPVLRRCTGGGTVLQGPGVLNYSLILRADGPSPFHSISATNHLILKRHQAALADLLRQPVDVRGCTDLAIGGLKFCGNAQRRKKQFLIFHGSFLMALDISMVEKTLPLPSIQPDYRLNRPHASFLMNLEVSDERIKEVLKRVWNARTSNEEPPMERVSALVREKYGQRAWNFKF